MPSDIYDGRRFVVVDIETIPCQDAAYLDELREGIKPPATLKKPESIEKWLEENRETSAREALAKTSFDPARGHICTIAWCENDSGVSVFHADSVDEEKAVLTNFFGALDPYHSYTICGHNVAAFDIPFILRRAIALGVKIPSGFPKDPKPWDKKIFDTMTAWSGARDRISMDNLCKALGIEGKADGFDGSQVAEAWANGEHEKIANYCCDDVRRTREILKRFLEVGY